MKILEISGCNLASLKEPFRIALDQRPFAQDGLFAIRGVTGSGKSTLIDAMCLALYDDAPRFLGRGGPKTGLADQEDKDRVSATDPRSILHRGAAQGFAQVIFRGVDDQRWRARWSVARARQKAGGRLQGQELELENLDTQIPCPGTRVEILKQIQAKVGLTYEQFRRSVLLAQGEFAAFAKADQDERAALLEAMTGTEIYARLSVAAQKRSAQEEQVLKDLNTQREALGLLSDAARGEKAAEEEALTARAERLEQERTGVLGDLAWYARCSELERQLDDAAAKAELARADHALAQARSDMLQRVDSAQPLRALQTTLAQGADQRASLERQIIRLQAELPAAEAAARERQEDLLASRGALARALEAVEAARPDLEAARVLDTRIADAKGKVLQVSEQAIQLADAALEAERARDASLRAERGLAQRQAEVELELEASRGFGPLAQAWTRVDQDLQAYARALTGMGERSAALAALKEERSCREETQACLQDGLTALAARLAQQQGDLDALEQRIAQDPRAILDRDRKAAQARMDRCLEAERILQRLHPLLERLGAAEQEARTQFLAQAGFDRDGQEAQAGLLALEARLLEARSALEKVQAAMSLEQRRHQLVPGEACPLCGSLEHPWAGGSPLAGLIEAQREQVRSLEAANAALEHAGAAARAQGLEAGKAGAKALKEAAVHAARVEQEERSWAAVGPEYEDLPADGRPPRALALVRERILGLRDQLAGIAGRETALLGLETRAQGLRQELRVAEGQRKEVEARIKALDSEGQRLEARQAESASELATFTGALAARTEALAPLLDPEAMAALERDPAALRATLAAAVRKRLGAEATRLELQRQLGELALTLERERVAASAKRALALDGQALNREAGSALDRLQEQRRGCLDGRDALEVEQALAGARKTAEAVLEQARIVAQAAGKAMDDRGNTIATLQDQLTRKAVEVQAAQDAFETAVRLWGEPAEQLEALLAWTPGQIQTERAGLQAIDTAWSRAQAVLGEHRNALEAHRVSGCPEQPQESLAASALALKAALDELKLALGGVQADLRRDDLARRNATRLAGTIRDQEVRAQLWREMNQLIGSADGKKFRTYAQSLTLEALIAFANDQLARLNPRYRLQRIPGYELELQVIDQDMGDEIRSLNSLSGGETFLVSLALALGLSSLSSSDTPIDSLFIDEGFGTLDSETLETALSVLDELQSQGRQVGIISHVDGLATHIPVQIVVEKLGGGKSRVILPAECGVS